MAGGDLESVTFDGNDYWYEAAANKPSSAGVVAHLLPNFDEYTIGYRDRSALIPTGGRFDRSLYSFGSILSNILTIDGGVRRAWRRSFVRGRVLVGIRVSGGPPPPRSAAVGENRPAP